MSEPIPRSPAWVRLLLLPVALLRFLPFHASPVPPPRRPERARPYVASAAVPPDYERFCELHTRHVSRWRLTYTPGHAAPYQAHHRAAEGIVLSAGDLDSLEFALTAFTPPPRTRPYLDHGAQTRPTSRTLAADEAHALHQLADDLAASAQDSACWASAIRESSLEMLARIAARLGDACGHPAPDRHSCLRPSCHEGHHLDALGRAWELAAEDAR
ncbi:hypothetical protein [Streptomonospora litoralis]|uniref:Uncharacterized protein n=1 Tax=Streptomonospora litoralis TaxID=2498135 RepID=A0A4P6Q4E1_9ACTN|nr:hypothetical protein [Streptomonospora litoralis]QBI55515.1 hypothetical protein EKD16_18760 [Streptomonospora litoralis]